MTATPGATRVPAAAGLPTDPSGTTGRVASWLAELSLDRVPEQVRERAKYLTLDGVACALVGAQLPWSRRASELVRELEGVGPGSVLGTGERTTPPAAALLNGTFIQGFEIDDYHPLGPLHSASVVLPAALAAAEQLGARADGPVIDGAWFLLAVVAGYELGPRVGMALHGGDMISRGWHSGSVFGTHAAAAAAGVLYGLDGAGFEDALGLAGTQSSGLMAAQYEAMCKRMHHGFSARAGLYGAALAAGGFTGIKRVFEREYGGFLGTFGAGGREPIAEELTDDLGLRWEIERISVKPYAAQGGTHAAIDAVLRIRAERPFAPADVERVDVWVGHTVYHHGVWDVLRPLNEIGAQMSLAYGVAAAIVDGTVLVEQFTASRLDRDVVWDLVRRVTAHHDERIDAMGPRSRLHTRLRITFTDGTTQEAVVATPSGGLDRPLSNPQILAKFRTLTGPIIDPTRQEQIVDVVLNLERVDAVRDLVVLLAPPVGSALD